MVSAAQNGAVRAQLRVQGGEDYVTPGDANHRMEKMNTCKVHTKGQLTSRAPRVRDKHQNSLAG